MKILDHYYCQLSRDRNSHSRSDYERVQSLNHIHERDQHKQSDRRFCDVNNHIDVEHDFHSDEQKTSLLEINHEDHDLLR